MSRKARRRSAADAVGAAEATASKQPADAAPRNPSDYLHAMYVSSDRGLSLNAQWRDVDALRATPSGHATHSTSSKAAPAAVRPKRTAAASSAATTGQEDAIQDLSERFTSLAEDVTSLKTTLQRIELQLTRAVGVGRDVAARPGASRPPASELAA